MSAITTNSLAVAQAIATPYQRELLARIHEDELDQVGDFAWPDGQDGPLELHVGQRKLALPAQEPGLERMVEMAEQGAYARMWARLYAQADDMTYSGGRDLRRRMDRIAGEEITGGWVNAGQEQMPIEGARRDVERGS